MPYSTPVGAVLDDGPIDLAVEQELEPEAIPALLVAQPDPLGAASEDLAAEPDVLEAEERELQDAIFESCSIRPLTPSVNVSMLAP